MSLANMVRRMGEAGAPPEAIAIALEEIEAIQSALSARRSADRDRKRTQRQKTADVTGHSEDCPHLSHPTPSPLTPPLKDPQTPKITPPISPQPGSPASLKPEHVLETWNEIATRNGLPTAAKLSESRRRQCQARIRGSPDPVAEFSAAFDAVERSSFLKGENDKGWRANFDFFLQPSSFQKLIEGNYDRPH